MLNTSSCKISCQFYFFGEKKRFSAFDQKGPGRRPHPKSSSLYFKSQMTLVQNGWGRLLSSNFEQLFALNSFTDTVLPCQFMRVFNMTDFKMTNQVLCKMTDRTLNMNDLLITLNLTFYDL